MDNELIDQGLTLMLAGMGTVFVFLTALVVAMDRLRVPDRTGRRNVSDVKSSGTSSNDDLRGGCYGR
jgi:Na+-transporting methylmalonyl-CoA/oxaloacetate decarboxylase gamma subunit